MTGLARSGFFSRSGRMRMPPRDRPRGWGGGAGSADVGAGTRVPDDGVPKYFRFSLRRSAVRLENGSSVQRV